MSAERQPAQGTRGPRKESIGSELQARQYVLLSLWLSPVITNFSTLKVFSSFPAQSRAKISPSLCTVRGESYVALVSASLIKVSGGSLAKPPKQKDTEQSQGFYNSWLLLIFSLSSRTVNCMTKSYKVSPIADHQKLGMKV